MIGAVLLDTLRRNWRQTLYWGIGFAFVGFATVIMVPNVEFLNQMLELLETLPPILVAAVGAGDDLSFVATPEGFLAVGFFGKLLLFFAAYPVIMGMRVTANEEDEGVLDVVLSLPIPRWRVIAERFLAFSLTTALLVALLLVGIWLGEQASTIVTLNMSRVGETVFNMFPGLLLILAFTIFVGSILRRKQWVLAIATIFVVVSFMLDTVGTMGKGSIAENLRVLSFFSYFNATGVMKNGLVWANVIGLIVVAISLVTVSLPLFQRRDIG